MAIQGVIPSPAAAAGQLSAPPARQQPDAPVPSEKKNPAQDTVRLSTGAGNTVVQPPPAGPPSPATPRVEQPPAATENQRPATATAPSAPAAEAPAGQGTDAERTNQPAPAPQARTAGLPTPAEGTATDNRARQESRAVNQVLASQAERSYAAASLQGRINRNGFSETA